MVMGIGLAVASAPNPGHAVSDLDFTGGFTVPSGDVILSSGNVQADSIYVSGSIQAGSLDVSGDIQSSGELSGASLKITGNTDIDGNLETAGLVVGGYCYDSSEENCCGTWGDAHCTGFRGYNRGCDRGVARVISGWTLCITTAEHP